MINTEYRCEHIGVVAILADIRGLNVRRGFAGRFRAVMTIEAASGDVDVIEIRWQPTRSRMAVIAIVATGNVGQVFAGCRKTVVASPTSANYLCVIDC